jgi:FkbM family methyltransferase
LTSPTLPARARWKLAHALWPERLRPDKLLERWRLRACEAEAVTRWHAAGGEANGRPRPEARSQTGEDALLWDLLGDREDGFFVEAGAFDGYTFSVSYLFECVGWGGVLVEPLADRAAECEARRPGSLVVHAALSDHGSAPTASFARNSSVEWESRLDPDRGEDGERVPLVTLDDVLEGHGGPIDFVVLDVEGHELSTLRGFDLARWRPTALLIEENSGGRDQAVRRHVEDRDYVYVASLAQNDLYLRRDELSLARRLERFWDDLGPF